MSKRRRRKKERVKDNLLRISYQPYILEKTSHVSSLEGIKRKENFFYFFTSF
jgi:hypothetical protein